MAFFANPITLPIVWDYLIVSGQVAPGLCKISDAPRANKWDVKDGPGTQGATTTYRGNQVAEFTAKLLLGWSSPSRDGTQDLDNLAAFLNLLDFDPTKNANEAALDISHPALDVPNPPIRAAALKEIGTLTSAGPGGLWTIDLKFIEYRPPKAKNATSTPQGSTPASVSGALAGNLANWRPSQPSVQDKNDILIGQLRQRAGL